MILIKANSLLEIALQSNALLSLLGVSTILSRPFSFVIFQIIYIEIQNQSVSSFKYGVKNGGC